MEQKQVCCGSVVPPLSANYPWFVVQKLEPENDNQVQILYTVLHDHPPMSRYHQCPIPDLLGKRIRGSFHGWVFLSSHPDGVKWSLWNPITSKLIRLPPLPDSSSSDDNIRYCCLSCPPDDPNSVVLLTRTKTPNFVFCRLDRKKKKLRWTEMTYSKQVKNITGFDGWLHWLTCCNGKVYAYIEANADIRVCHCLVQVDIVVKDRGEVVISLLPFSIVPFLNPILKGSCTQLFAIDIGFKDETNQLEPGSVHVYKMDMTDMMWDEDEDLKDTVFSVELASDVSVLYNPAITSSEFGGGGYIHIFAKNRKIIYSYHVKDQTISLSSLPCLVQTSHLSIPECSSRLEGDHADSKEAAAAAAAKDDEIVSVKEDKVELNNRVDDDNDHDESHLLSSWFCAGVKYLNKFLPVSCFGYENRLEGDDADCKQDKDDEIVVRSLVKSDGMGFKSTTDESHLLSIPFHVLEKIMEFCVGVEYLNFRATCKHCHLAAPTIQWSNKTSLTRLHKYSLLSPWLVVFNYMTGIVTFTDPVFGDNYFIQTPPGLLCDFQIHCSRYGWLLILVIGRLVFYNPFTSDIRELAVVPPSDLESFCFSAPPTSLDCMVVGFTTSLEQHVYIHFVAREPIWIAMGLHFERGVPYSFRFPTFYGRDLYALCNKGEINVFTEIDKEDGPWETLVDKAPTSCCKSLLAQYFLVKCDRHCLLVIVGEFGESIEVFKLDDYEGKWEKIDSLGRHMVYICDRTCLCVEAKIPEMENKIYFPRLHSRKIVFYSLETCRYHTFNGKNIQESFGDFFGCRQYLSPHAWIEPSWS